MEFRPLQIIDVQTSKDFRYFAQLRIGLLKTGIPTRHAEHMLDTFAAVELVVDATEFFVQVLDSLAALFQFLSKLTGFGRMLPAGLHVYSPNVFVVVVPKVLEDLRVRDCLEDGATITSPLAIYLEHQV